MDRERNRGQHALQGRPRHCGISRKASTHPPTTHPPSIYASIHPKGFIEQLLGTQRWMRGVSCPQKAGSLVGESSESADNYRKPRASLYNGIGAEESVTLWGTLNLELSSGAPKASDYWQGHPFSASHPRMGDPVSALGAGLCPGPGVPPTTPLRRSRAQGTDDSTPESARRPPAPQRLSPHLVIFRSPGASPTALRRQLGKQTQRQIVPRLIPGKDAKSHPATPNTPSPPPPPGSPPRRGASAGWGPSKRWGPFLPSRGGRGVLQEPQGRGSPLRPLPSRRGAAEDIRGGPSPGRADDAPAGGA